MKFYLSSFKLGNRPSDYCSLLDSKKSVGYIPNALDHLVGKMDDWLYDHVSEDIRSLEEMDLNVGVINLKEYFDSPTELIQTLSALSGLWVSGGNVFVLRQAMNLSGLDFIMCNDSLGENFVYGGYSAACCVLSPTLKPVWSKNSADAFVL